MAEPRAPRLGTRARAIVLAAVVLASVSVAIGYAWWTARRAAELPAAEPVPASLRLERVRPAQVLHRIEGGPHAGRIAQAAPSEAGAQADRAPASIAELRCERVHYAAGRGLCLTLEPGATRRLVAAFFDEDLKVLASHRTAGIASRTRISPDGRYAASTAFVTGHSYAGGSFSTETRIWDAVAGRPIAQLQSFFIERDGRRFEAVDVNFWGVTFARDGERFYATMSTGGVPYLVEGSVATRRVRVLRPNVECPSLSPDGRRIAFKRRVASGGWEPWLLDLGSGAERRIAGEDRSVDDQFEWLDDTTILYARAERTAWWRAAEAPRLWALDVDRGVAPVVFRSGATSPAVVR
jgi:hypothetical protein